MSDVGIAGGRIRSFVERIEHIEAEVAELNEGKKEVLAEARAFLGYSNAYPELAM